MLQTQSFLPSPAIETVQAPMPKHFTPAMRRPCRLRHYLVGSPEDTQHAINRLHLLGYLDRVSWSHVIAIPNDGLIVRPNDGEILRYSQRDRLG